MAFMRVDQAARRVRVSAAISAAQAAMTATDPTMELAVDRLAAPRANRTLVRGAARSLLVTPWFAASMGVVLAAGLWIRAPHTVLRFPNSAPQTQFCANCSTEHPQLATSTPGQKIKDSAHSGRRAGAGKAGKRRSVEGIAFTYAILQHGDRFSEVITLSGRKLPAHWVLWFEILGTRISNVEGVHWQLWSSENGATFTPARPEQYGPLGRSDGAEFVVIGRGVATRPVSCKFDGLNCSFTQEPLGGPGGRSGHGHHHGQGYGGNQGQGGDQGQGGQSQGGQG
jgi:hypothetical protein